MSEKQQRICDQGCVCLDHDITNKVGWIEEMYMDEKYSANSRWYTALIFTMRIPKDKMQEIMAKYGETSPYALNYSISYIPKGVEFERNGNKMFKITGFDFVEVSIVNDPAFPMCRTIFVYKKKNTNPVNIVSSLFNLKKKKYCISQDSENKNLYITFEMSNGQQVPVVPNQAVPQQQMQPLAQVQQLGQVNHGVTTGQPPVTQQQQQQPSVAQHQSQGNVPPVDQQQTEQAFDLLYRRFGFKYDAVKASNDPKFLLKIMEEQLLPGLHSFAVQEDKEKKNFQAQRNKELDSVIANYKFLNQNVSDAEVQQMSELLYAIDYKNPIDKLINAQRQLVESKKKDLMYGTGQTQQRQTQQPNTTCQLPNLFRQPKVHPQFMFGTTQPQTQQKPPQTQPLGFGEPQQQQQTQPLGFGSPQQQQLLGQQQFGATQGLPIMNNGLVPTSGLIKIDNSAAKREKAPNYNDRYWKDRLSTRGSLRIIQ